MRSRLFNKFGQTQPVVASKGEVKLGTISKSIPFQKIPDGSGWFLYFKLNDQPDLVEEGAKLIAERINTLALKNVFFVTPEASTIALAHVLRTTYKMDGLIIYKNPQINDEEPLFVEYDVITATNKKELFLGRNKIKEFDLVNKEIVIIDSICTKGGTICATYKLLTDAGVKPEHIKEAITLFNEGEPKNSIGVLPHVNLKLTSFSQLPIIKKVNNQQEVPYVFKKN